MGITGTLSGAGVVETATALVSVPFNETLTGTSGLGLFILFHVDFLGDLEGFLFLDRD